MAGEYRKEHVCMTKQELKQQVTDVVRGTLRKEGYYSENGDALLSLGEVVDGISVDRKRILSHVRQALNEGGNNPLNAFLGLAGLRIVKLERTVQEIGSTIGGESYTEMIVEDTGAAGSIDSLLRLDREKVAAAVERMALDLHEKSAAGSRTIDSIRDQMDKSHSEMERTSAELQQLRADHRETLHQIAAWAQRILVPDSGDQMTEKAMSLLEDMDISVYWSAEGSGFSQSAMFTTLRRSPSYRGRNQPCLVKGGQVLLKGLLLIDEDPA